MVCRDTNYYCWKPDNGGRGCMVLRLSLVGSQQNKIATCPWVSVLCLKSVPSSPLLTES